MIIADLHTPNWQPKLGELGAVVQDLADIEQAIGIIVTTPQGSVPHRPGFGVDVASYLDRPLSEARPALVREITDAVTVWEPRAALLGVEVSVDPDDASPGAMMVRIRWSPLGGEGGRITEVIL